MRATPTSSVSSSTDRPVGSTQSPWHPLSGQARNSQITESGAHTSLGPLTNPTPPDTRSRYTGDLGPSRAPSVRSWERCEVCDGSGLPRQLCRRSPCFQAVATPGAEAARMSRYRVACAELSIHALWLLCARMKTCVSGRGISAACLHRWLKMAEVEDRVRHGVITVEAVELRDARKRIGCSNRRTRSGVGRRCSSLDMLVAQRRRSCARVAGS